MRQRIAERGTSLVELAFIVPLLVLLVLGVIDMGRLLFTQITLHAAVQEGSLYVSQDPTDPMGARTRVVESVDDPGLDINRVVVDCPSGPTGPIRVRAEHDVNLITPVFGAGVVTLDAEATGDRFAPDGCSTSP